jgi:hypothetical protein
VYETDDDLRWLQSLLEQNHARMDAYMRTILTPERTLTARQIVTYLRGITHVALATVTRSGEPRVAPLDGLFIRGASTWGRGAPPSV